MKSLGKYVNGDAFDDGLDAKLIKEYEERNTRKKEDEAWLKKNSPLIKNAMDKLGKSKAEVNGISISVSVPDASSFDMDKVLEYLKDNLEPLDFNTCTKLVVSEDDLTILIEKGVINLDDLKEYAWVTKQGTPRLIVSKIKPKKE